jgi:hypothetical protein
MTTSDAPSGAALRRATVTVVLLAVIVSLVAVLPAEYGIDPTGVGKRLGLTQMGQLKQQLALEALEDLQADSAAAAAAAGAAAPDAVTR